MNHQGHGLALEHPIFNTPRKPAFETSVAEREPHHEGYTSPLYPAGMGETFVLYDFEVDHPEGQWNPTLVAHEGFFTDVPGFENLAEGRSSKMLGSLSLARQGRYFYWGYSIDPERSTPAAKDTLVNVIHYMHSKRDSLTVEFVCATRQSLWIYWDLNRRTGYERGIQEHFLGAVQARSRVKYEPTEGAKAWLDEHLPYVFSGKGPEHTSERYKTVFEVDFDAKALGTPNRERTSLERWIELSLAGKDWRRECALRCLDRYVQPSIAPSDGDWKAWYARLADRIVFIESTGFWWQVDPRVLELEQAGR